jgi:hypothetical protein
MRKILACAAMAAMIVLAWNADGATVVQKKALARKKPGKKKGASTASSRGKNAPAKRGVTWRNRQTAPTPDRYREIQGALAAKGYLKPEDATGTWNQKSADGLKKFQTEQNLESSGKINSLSLIALGLGPKHDSPPAAPPKPPQQPPGQ